MAGWCWRVDEASALLALFDCGQRRQSAPLVALGFFAPANETDWWSSSAAATP
jgi:hypothetical protein